MQVDHLGHWVSPLRTHGLEYQFLMEAEHYLEGWICFYHCCHEMQFSKVYTQSNVTLTVY